MELPGDNRPAVYFEDDETGGYWVIRASAIGGCVYELIAWGQEYEALPPPATLARAWAEGHEHEGTVIAELERSGWTMLSTQQEGELLVRASSDDRPGIKVRFHPDAVGLPPERNPTTTVVEVKNFSDDNWRKAARHGVGAIVGEYEWQASVMMLGLDMPLMWAYRNKGHAPDETGVKAYCEDEGQIRYQFVDVPPISRTEIVNRAVEVVEAIMGDDLLESGAKCTNPGQWPCRFRHLLPEEDGKQEDSGTLYLTDTDAQEVDRLVKERQFLKGQMDEMERRYTEANRRLISIADRGGPGIKRLKTDTWTVPIVEGQGNGRYEVDRMSPQLRKVIQQYWKRGKRYKYVRGIKRTD